MTLKGLKIKDLHTHDKYTGEIRISDRHFFKSNFSPDWCGPVGRALCPQTERSLV